MKLSRISQLNKKIRPNILYILIGVILVVVLSALAFSSLAKKGVRRSFGGEYKYVYSDTNFKLGNVFFGEYNSKLPVVTIKDKDREIKISYLPAGGEEKDEYNIQTSNTNQITYYDIRPNTNLKYTMDGKSAVKEEIELTQKPKQEDDLKYKFQIKLTNLKIQKDENGNVASVFLSSDNEEYVLPPLFMTDKKGERSNDVSFRLTQTNPNDETVLTAEVLPDMLWLLDEDREYPVLIDPTVEKGAASIALWRFDEGYGGTAHDSSINANHGDADGSSSTPNIIRQEINIVDTIVTASGDDPALVSLDTTKYNGTILYYFEAVATVASGTLTLALERDGTATQDSTLSFTETSLTRKRSTAFSPPAGATTYNINLSGGTTPQVKAARIIIIQSEGGITATQTQIEIGNKETGKTDTSLTALANPKYWKYTAANWDGSTSFTASVTYKNSGTNTATQTYTSGSGNWTAPRAVPSVKVEAWGAGGGGGVVASSGGGGGGGGAYARTDAVVVSPGTSYPYVVGAGGTADNAAAATDTTFNTSTVVADSGLGTSTATGVAGGTTANSTGASAEYAGSAGKNGNSTGDSGGGGGGAGGPAGAGGASAAATTTQGGVGGTGNNGSGGAGGLADTNDGTDPNGGNGGSHATGGGGGGGGDNGDYGGNGGAPGGGGGGGEITGGQVGGAGQIILTWPSAAEFVLQEDDGSFGSWTNKATILASGTATTQTLAVSSSFTPTDGRNYRIVAARSDTAITYDIYNAKIIVTQTGTISKLEPQYMLLNTADSGSTGLQSVSTLWDSTEWQLVTNTYKYSHDSTNASDSSKIQDTSNGNADITNATVTGANQQIGASAFTMPVTNHNLDVNVTDTTGVVNASRIIVASVLGVDSSATTAPDWTTESSCKINKCLFFNGDNDVVTVPNASTIDLDDGLVAGFTISIWVKPSSLGEGSAGEIFNANSTTYARLAAGSTGAVADLLVSLDLSSSDATVTIDDALTFDEWQQVSITYIDDAEDEIKIYKNGIYKGTSTNGSGTPQTTSADFYIGGASTNNFHGYIDEFGIFPEERTAHQIIIGYAGGGNYGSAAKLGNPPAASGVAPIIYYDFNEADNTTTVYDKSGNLNHGTMNGTMAQDDWVPGKFGTGLSFDGSDDYLSGGDVVGADFLDTENFTVEFWMKRDTDTTDDTVVAKKSDQTSGTAGWIVWIDDATDDVRLAVSDGDSTNIHVIDSVEAINTTSWYHVAIVYNDTSTSASQIYINGANNEATNNTTGTFASIASLENTSSLNVGAESDGGSPFSGTLDDVRVYDYARTQGQIIEDLNAGHPLGGSPIGSQVAYWKFDEMEGTTANDTTINDVDLTLSSTSWTTDGKFGGAWNGTGAIWLARVDDPDVDFVANDDFTISMWFKSDSAANPGANQYLIDKQTPTDNPGYTMYFNTSGFIVCAIDDDTAAFPEDSVTSTIDYYDATWHNVMCIRDIAGSRLAMYIDGKFHASDATLSATGSLANTGSITIADDDSDATNAFAGDLDEVKIYRAALTDSQIKIDINKGASLILGNAGTNAANPNLGDNSARRAFCPPGNTETNCADGQNPEPVLYLQMDTSTLYLDTSTYNHTGFDANDPPNVQGYYGQGAGLNGTNQAVQITSTSNITPGSSSYTTTFWAKIPNTAITKGFIQKFSTGTNNGFSAVVCNVSTCGLAGEAVHYLHAGGGSNYRVVETTNDIADGLWHHYAFVANATADTVIIYVDGVYVPQSGYALGTWPNVSYTGDLYIGVGYGGGYIAGTMDEYKTYRYARTEAQVAWDMNFGKPIAWYRMDECELTTINEAMGNGFTGTLTNAATPGTCAGSGSWLAGAGGAVNASIDLDGSNDFITVADPANSYLDFPAAASFSLSGWFNRDTFTTDDVILAKRNGDAAADVGYIVYIDDSTDKLVFEVSDGTDEYSLTSTSTFTATGWNHFSVVWDDDSATNSEIYINGKPDLATDSGTIGSIDALSNAVPLRFGDLSDGNATGGTSVTVTHYFDGKLDDIRIYTYPQSLQQVRDVFNTDAVSFK